MIWFLIFIVIIVALGIRIYACVQKSKESGDTWNFKDKYVANDFGEWKRHVNIGTIETRIVKQKENALTNKDIRQGVLKISQGKFKVSNIVLQNIPNREDVAHRSPQNKEMEDGMHVRAFVEGIEQSTGDVAHSFSDNPTDGMGADGIH